MTPPGEVRVTVARVCPAGCRNGDRRITLCYDDKGKHPLPREMGEARYTYRGTCPTCHGDGVVWEPVTCAGCRYLDTSGINHPGCELVPEIAEPGLFACAAWEPREPRS